MKKKFSWARAAGLLGLVVAFGLAWTEVATDAVAQSAPLRRASTGYFVGKVADFANGRLTVITDDGLVLKATVSPRTKIALLKPADLQDLEEGVFIAAAGREVDNDSVEALEVRIMEPRLNGIGEGYRAFHGGLEAEVVAHAKVVAVENEASPPTVQVRVRGRDKTIVVPNEAPIMFQLTGDTTALVADAPVMVFTVRSRTGKTDVVRVNIGVDGVVPQIF